MYPKENIVLLVDADNNPIGEMEKIEAHRRGIMHRAVSVLVFDPEGRWLLHRSMGVESRKWHKTHI